MNNLSLALEYGLVALTVVIVLIGVAAFVWAFYNAYRNGNLWRFSKEVTVELGRAIGYYFVLAILIFIIMLVLGVFILGVMQLL